MAKVEDKTLILLCFLDGRCEKGFIPIGIFTLDGAEEYCKKSFTDFRAGNDDGLDIYAFKMTQNCVWSSNERDFDASFSVGREDSLAWQNKVLPKFMNNLQKPKK